MRLAFAAVLGGLLGAGCAGAVPRLDATDARWASGKWPGTTVRDLENGRGLFVAKCGGCHSLPSPAAKTPDEWVGVVGEMAEGAGLSEEERDLVLRYLGAASQRLGRPGDQASGPLERRVRSRAARQQWSTRSF